MSVLDVMLNRDLPEAQRTGVLDWPHSVREVPEGSPLPPAPWRRMTPSAYAAHCAPHRPAQEAWLAARPVAAPIPAEVPLWKIKALLEQQGRLAAANTRVAALGPAVRHWWANGTMARRHGPHVAALNLSDAVLDAVFRAADALDD